MMTAERKKMKTRILYATALVLALVGCSSTEKKVDQAMADQSQVKSQADLRAHADSMIATTPGLSDDQRSKLTQLGDSTRAKLDNVRTESLQLRSALIHNVIASYNKSEVYAMKRRMKKLEDKRLSIIFNAVDEANKILGRQAQSNAKLFDELWMGHAGQIE